MAEKVTIVVVTDPMCSWCWGMAQDLQHTRETLADVVQFKLMLGGINTHGTQPIGDYGRRFLMRLWREVEATTGQTFGDTLPESYVHNSIAACVAIETVRQRHDEAAAFDALHVLQEAFFLHGTDITSREVLTSLLAQFNVHEEDLAQASADPSTKELLRFQFDAAGAYGTNAMPSLLIEQSNELKLLAGGYVDANMMHTLISRQ